MFDYSTFPYTLGVFPNVLGKNETNPGDKDGTPFYNQYIDDLWGANQALMDYAGLTPNGIQEAAGASQRLEAMKVIFGYPGEVVQWMGDSDPATLGLRLIPLEGQGILRANYPELDAAVYVGDPQNAAVAAAGGAFYHATDAGGVTPNPTGDYLILPDTRGYAPRGKDPGALRDPDGASRYLGDAQGHATQYHTHELRDGAGDYLDAYSTNVLAGAVPVAQVVTSPVGGRFFAESISGAPTDANESRMDNYQTVFAIRY